MTRVETLLSLDRVAVIAHRGGSKLRPENTLTAFDHALSLGVDALECDVHLSKDGEVVVIHDPTLERTTDAAGPVSALTAKELANVDAGYHFGEADRFPHRGRIGGVPRLQQVLDLCADRPLVIEIKGDQPATADRVVEVIRACGAVDRVIVGGFSYDVISVVRRKLPMVPTSASSPEARSALTRSHFWMPPRQPRFRLFQMPFRLKERQMFGRGFVRAARRGGLPVQAWIVDEPADMRRLIDWGVTGIISDRPDVAINVRNGVV